MFDIPTDMIQVCVFDFRKDGDVRYRIVKQQISEFLSDIELDERGWGKKVLEIWQRDFGRNASEHDRTRNITKRQMLWPLIVWLCEVGADDAEFAECDEAETNEILSKYKSVISDNVEQFEFVTKVMTSYSSYDQRLPSKKRTQKFISERWQDYALYFNLPNAEEVILERVVKMAVANVLKSRYKIEAVKKGTNL